MDRREGCFDGVRWDGSRRTRRNTTASGNPNAIGDALEDRIQTRSAREAVNRSIGRRVSGPSKAARPIGSSHLF